MTTTKLPHVNIEGRRLTVLPALIDPHVHFRVPGGEHKEDWKTAALAAVRGGVTTVCEMPNNIPPCTTYERLLAKKRLINAQLQAIGIPLRYALYFGADQGSLDQIALARREAVALKIFMGCSTGGLVIESDEALDTSFRLAKEAGMLVAVHAEDEILLKEAKKRFAKDLEKTSDFALHSKIRPREAAIRACEKALHYCAKYQTPLYLLHIGTKEELELVREAKKSALPVYAEVTTHHLFLSEEDYQKWGAFVQINPPLRRLEDQEALWEGIEDGTIDTIGTDHAPHTLEEKRLPFGRAPSGIPGVETLLPLMLDAVNRGRLTLKRLLQLVRYKSEEIFALPPNEDRVLVDLNLEKEVRAQELSSKCGWTPYEGRILRGWPLYTILGGEVYCANQGTLVGKQQLEAYLSANQGGVFAATQ
jgi:dihydroorotase